MRTLRVRASYTIQRCAAARCAKPPTKDDNWATIYYPPAPRAMIEVVDPAL